MTDVLQPAAAYGQVEDVDLDRLHHGGERRARAARGGRGRRRRRLDHGGRGRVLVGASP